MLQTSQLSQRQDESPSKLLAPVRSQQQSKKFSQTIKRQTTGGQKLSQTIAATSLRNSIASIGSKKSSIASTQSPLKQRPKSSRQKSEYNAKKEITAAQKFSYTAEDSELEHLRQQLEIYKKQASVANDMKSKSENLERQLETSQKAIKQQIRINEQQNTLITSQAEQIETLQEESEIQIEQNADLEKIRKEHQEEMMQSIKYMEQLEKRIYETNQVGLKLLTQIRDQTEEIDQLKAYVMELRAKVAFYIPINGDPLDEKIADYINNYPDRNKLKIMFVRESNGVYEFGNKRLEIRIVQNKIMIRVGGGYISIDEFIDQYTQGELDRMQRKDPLKKFAERVVMAKLTKNKDIASIKAQVKV